MSRQEIVKKLRKKNPSLNKIEIENVLDAFNESIKKALVDGKNVELRGFGIFFIKKIKEKFSARNPKTGKLIYVPEKNKVRFKSSKKLNKLINK